MGRMIGTVMIEIIKNQNPDFDLKKEIPAVGATEAFEAFKFFSLAFGNSLHFIKKLKKDFKFNNIE